MTSILFVVLILIVCLLHRAIGRFCSSHCQANWVTPFYLSWTIIAGSIIAVFLKKGWLGRVGLEANALTVTTLGLAIFYFLFDMSRCLKIIRDKEE